MSMQVNNAQETAKKRGTWRRKNHADIEAMQNLTIALIVQKRNSLRTQEEIEAKISFEMPTGVRHLISVLQGVHGGGEVPYEQFGRSYQTIGEQMQYTGTKEAVESRVRSRINELEEWQFSVGYQLFVIVKGGDFLYDERGKQRFHADGKTPMRETTQFIDHLKPVADDLAQLARASDLWRSKKCGQALQAQTPEALARLPKLGTRAESGAEKKPATGLPKGYEKQQAGKIVEIVKARATKIEENGGDSSMWIEDLFITAIEEEADMMELKGQDANLWLENLEVKLNRMRGSRRKTAPARLDYGSLALVEDASTASGDATKNKGKAESKDEDDPPPDGSPPLGKKNLTQSPTQPSTNQTLSGGSKVNNPPHMLSWALFWAGQGVPVFPAYEVFDGICACTDGSECKNRGKHPRYHKDDLRNGQEHATVDRAQIEAWWTRWPLANIAGVMGGADVAAISHRTRLLALDLDPRNGGSASLADLCEVYGLEWLDRTLQHKTGGGGLHFFFVIPDGAQVSKGKLAPGLDVKWRGYVMLPPSSHASGQDYEINLAQMARPAPEWLLEMLSTKQQTNVVDFQEEKDRRDLPSSEGKERFHEGDRNDGLFGVLIGRLRHGWASDMAELHAQALEINQARCVPPLDDVEVTKMVAHVFTDYSFLNSVDAQERTA
jgi:hypothetical protein